MLGINLQIPLKETKSDGWFFSGSFHFSFPAYRTSKKQSPEPYMLETSGFWRDRVDCTRAPGPSGMSSSVLSASVTSGDKNRSLGDSGHSQIALSLFEGTLFCQRETRRTNVARHFGVPVRFFRKHEGPQTGSMASQTERLQHGSAPLAK